METQSYTLLLADDNPANLDVLSKILREQGYRVRTALNGELALESIRAAAPDMALLDIHMPVMDGYELCKQMKSDPHIAHIPVMFVSGIGESFNKVIAFELGAVDYISKPVDPAEVVARVNTHLKMMELQRSLIRQNADLEDRVLARTAELHCALEELKELHQRLDALDKAKNDFLRLISHELRTPMVGLELFDDLIRRDQIPDGELANYRNMFWASHRKLVNIVDHATILTQINLQTLSPQTSKGHRVRGLILQATAPLLPL
ncbi:MAG: response regulator, partial [Opitutales bacterium]|nr:response regulator [Opitutales bacterium]